MRHSITVSLPGRKPGSKEEPLKIVVLDGYLVNHDRQPWAVAERFPELIWYDETPDDLAAERIGDADAVFANRTHIGRQVFESCPNLRYIGVFGTGYNIIDLKAAKEHGVTVCNVPEYSSQAVAQHTLALLLAVTNRVAEFSAYMKAGKWQLPGDPGVTAVPMMELAGKTVGILGYGGIGKAFGSVCQALGMRVLGFRRHPSGTEVVPIVDLDTLCRESDVLSIHCPLTDETRGMVNRDFLRRVKPGAILLNTARGAILNGQDVAEALDSGQLSAAGVDVFAHEPAGLEDPLVRHPRCIVTPHVSWGPRETRARLLQITADNFFAFLDGHPQNNVLDHLEK